MNTTNPSSTQWSLASEDMEVACDNPDHNGGRRIFACCRGAFASSAKLAEWEEERQQLMAVTLSSRPPAPVNANSPLGEISQCVADVRGAWLYLSRESWGIVCDGLVAQINALEQRKRINPASTADVGMAEAAKILRALNPLSNPTSITSVEISEHHRRAN